LDGGVSGFGGGDEKQCGLVAEEVQGHEHGGFGCCAWGDGVAALGGGEGVDVDVGFAGTGDSDEDGCF
jgi:hypothetical protein